MKRLNRFVGKEIVIIKEASGLSKTLTKIEAFPIVLIVGKLERNYHCGFYVQDVVGKSTYYFASSWLKARFKPHDKSLPRNFLTLKKGYEYVATKPPGSDGFEKRIRVKTFANLK